jgi:hypothetical protein
MREQNKKSVSVEGGEGGGGLFPHMNILLLL